MTNHFSSKEDKDMERKEVIVSNLIGSYGITLQDGETIYGVICPLLQAGDTVVLNFQDMEIFASPFFNASVGRLLSKFTDEYLRTHLDPINLTRVGQATLRRVIENAKEYYENDDVRAAVDQVLDEQAALV
jgi:hypothetical protein